MIYPAAWSAACTGLLLLVAGAAWCADRWDARRERLAVDAAVDARMDVPLAAARAELAEPVPPPYIAPVLGVRIGTRHPEPVEHLPVTYRPAHASGEVADTPSTYRGAHWRTDMTAEFHRIIARSYTPSLVESAT